MAVELSDEQIDEIKSVFTQYDSDGDGKISIDDFNNIMKELGNVSTYDELKFIVNI
jgi:Ca2+-binding EF-hand superfamily protein